MITDRDILNAYHDYHGHQTNAAKSLGMPRTTFQRKHKEILALPRDSSIIGLISDTHAPYQHKDTLPFLAEIASTYKPTRWVHIGDEEDKHAMSYHEPDPDLPSARDEQELARPFIHELEDMFPYMDLLESNHGSLHLRKAKSGGIPSNYIKPYHEIIGVSERWQWHDELVLVSGDRKIMFHHGMSINALNNAKEMGMSFVQGHHHGRFDIGYYGTDDALNFGMTIGCLINKKALAFAYGKNFPKKPMIGTGIIIEGVPHLLPMQLDNHGRWIGRL